jgi:hypothetical protein
VGVTNLPICQCETKTVGIVMAVLLASAIANQSPLCWRNVNNCGSASSRQSYVPPSLTRGLLAFVTYVFGLRISLLCSPPVTVYWSGAECTVCSLAFDIVIGGSSLVVLSSNLERGDSEGMYFGSALCCSGDSLSPPFPSGVSHTYRGCRSGCSDSQAGVRSGVLVP